MRLTCDTKPSFSLFKFFFVFIQGFVLLQNGGDSSDQRRGKSFGQSRKLAEVRVWIVRSYLQGNLPTNGSSLPSCLEYPTSKRFDLSSILSPHIYSQSRISLRPQSGDLQRKGHRYLRSGSGKKNKFRFLVGYISCLSYYYFRVNLTLRDILDILTPICKLNHFLTLCLF